MRIQNEGTGKSSWWVINPDAKPGKAPRRRAGSMETKNLEKKRGRIKKRVEAIRAAQENGTLSKDDFPELHYTLNLSPEFRTRAGSNASSCGRLSPIQAAVEPDLHDGQVPPMSPIPWGTELDTDDNYTQGSEGNYSLVDSLVGNMNLSESGNLQQDMEMLGTAIKQEIISGGNVSQFTSSNSYDTNFVNLPAPPSYNDHLQKQNSQSTVLNLDRMVIQNRDYMGMQPKQQGNFSDNMYQDGGLRLQERLMAQQQGMASPGSNTLGINTQQMSPSPGRSPQLSPNFSNQHQAYSQQVHSPQLNKRISPQPIQNQQQSLSSQQLAGNRSLLQQCLEAPNDSLLRAALTQTGAPYQQNAMSQNRAFSQYNGGFTPATGPSFTGSLNNMNNNLHQQQQSMGQMNMVQGGHQSVQIAGGQVRNSSNPDIENIDTDSMLDLDYDVEQLLRHEIAMDPNLDFNFDNQTNQNMSTSESRNLVR